MCIFSLLGYSLSYVARPLARRHVSLFVTIFSLFLQKAVQTLHKPHRGLQAAFLSLGKANRSQPILAYVH